MTTQLQISEWFDRGVLEGYLYMLIICDTFDHEDYPSYRNTKHDALELKKEPGSMQRIMEIYDLTADKEQQLSQHRSRAL